MRYLFIKRLMIFSKVVAGLCCWRVVLHWIPWSAPTEAAKAKTLVLAVVAWLVCCPHFAMARPVVDDQSLFERVPLAMSLATPTLKLKGQLKQGAFLIGKVAPASSVSLNDSELKVSAGGLFVLGFSRDARPEQQIKVYDAAGKASVHEFAVAAREYQTQYIEGIAKKLMQPSQQDLQRIQEESALVRQARAVNSDMVSFTEPFIWPAKGPVTGVYGSQRFFNGQPRRPHFGLDIAAPSGTDVVAPASGVITLVHSDMFYSGGTIVLDHGYGMSSTFIHLSEELVTPGQKVKQGEVIGKVGKSGRATGPHLDWRINWFDTRLDPAFLVGLQVEER